LSVPKKVSWSNEVVVVTSLPRPSNAFSPLVLKDCVAKPSVKSYYDMCLCHKIKDVVAIEGGLALDKLSRVQFGRKSYLSLAQLKEKKDIKSGKQATIVRALGEGKSHTKGSQ
jgi:hypothetical protein